MESNENYYNKILLWNDIANEIAYFGVQCGITNLIDYIDMNCGAVAVGEYKNVIDPDAADQFLALYAGIARKRLAFACHHVFAMGDEAKPVVKKFIADVGKNNGGFTANNVHEAYDRLGAFLLEQIPGKPSCNEVISEDVMKIIWKKGTDLFVNPWKAADSDVAIYHEIEESFINGLFENSGFGYMRNGDSYSLQSI